MARRFAVAGIVMSIVVTVHGCPHQCPPKQSNPGPLVPGDNIIHQYLIRVEKDTFFTCCADGFTNISWYHWDEGKQTFSPFLPIRGTVQICNDGQVLDILHVKQNFEGKFQCLITNGTAQISINYTLTVDACDKMLHIPRVTIPPKNVFAKVGDSVKLSCEGFFGCGDIPSLKTVIWFSKNSEGKLKLFMNGNHSNYIYEIYHRSNWDYVGANLTIHSVMKENFTQLFFCDINSVRFNVSILRSDAMVTAGFEEYQIIIIASASACVFLLSVMLVVFCWLYFMQISFWCNTKCNKFSRKGEFVYDTALVCIEKDVPVVQERLLPMLRETLGYSVYFSHEDIHPGCGETSGEAGMFPNTYCAIMFVSKESLEENSFKFVCQSAMCLVGGPYMILIKKEDIPQSVWKSVPRDLERRLKIIQTLTLPDVQKSNVKSVQRFWNVIQSKLPKPQRIEKANKDRDSLKPLIVL